MSNEKETPETAEAAKPFEEGMELLNRRRNEMLAVRIIQTPRERAIAEFEAEVALEREPNPLEINSRVTRLRMAARERRDETVQ